MTPDRLDIVVVTHDTASLLLRLLVSIRDVLPPHAIGAVHVWDNGSTDQTQTLLAAFGQSVPWLVSHRSERNLQHGPALDRALRHHVRGDWVLLLDSDTELSSDFRGALPPLDGPRPPAFVGQVHPELGPLYAYLAHLLLHRPTCLDLPPFRDDGAPGRDFFRAVADRGLPWLRFRWSDHIHHLGQGTLRMLVDRRRLDHPLHAFAEQSVRSTPTTEQRLRLLDQLERDLESFLSGRASVVVPASTRPRTPPIGRARPLAPGVRHEADDRSAAPRVSSQPPPIASPVVSSVSSQCPPTPAAVVSTASSPSPSPSAGPVAPSDPTPGATLAGAAVRPATASPCPRQYSFAPTGSSNWGAAIRGHLPPVLRRARVLHRAGRVGMVQKRAEAAALLRRVEALAPQRVLEIGTAYGGTLLLWAQAAAADATLISVDLPPWELDDEGEPRRVERLGALRRARQTLHLWRGDSHAASTRAQVVDWLAGEPLDFLFVDGDHSLAGVRADFDDYAPLVRSGGLIALHDVRPHSLGWGGDVPQFWLELQAEHVTSVLLADAAQDGFGIGLVHVTPGAGHVQPARDQGPSSSRPSSREK